MAGVKGRFLGKLKEEQGAVIALVAFMMVGLLGFMALAVDLGHLYMVRNELQNAADAGALAGASVLYNDHATQVNAGANQVAYDTATANRASVFPSGWSVVQVNWTSGTNDGDVQRGHYNYATGVFTANASLNPVDLLPGTETVLNADTNFINAVRVVTRTSTRSLFANFLGVATSDLSAEAIAYIGFAKELHPRDAEQPIAICQDWLNTNPCNQYRVVPDSGTPNQIARWMTLNQASTPSDDISCGEILRGNQDILSFETAMTITAIASGPFSDFRDQNWDSNTRCAMNDSDDDGIRDAPIDSNNNLIPDRPWILSLPVIDCTNTVSTPPLGRVMVEILWITPADNPSTLQSEICSTAPRRMYNSATGSEWTNFSSDGWLRWHDPVTGFATRFSLRNSSGQILDDCTQPNLQNVMFIKPVCETVNGTNRPVRPLTGSTGTTIYGQRGQLAKYPVLVK